MDHLETESPKLPTNTDFSASRIVIVGGTSAGVAAAAKLRRELYSKKIEIVLFEQSPHVALGSCGLPFALSGKISDPNSLVLNSPEFFKRRFNVDVRVNTAVVKIDKAKKSVTFAPSEHVAPDLSVDEEHCSSMTYDKLLIATGSEIFIPPIPGAIRNKTLFGVKWLSDVQEIKRRMGWASGSDFKILVVGCGFIGVETIEELARTEADVTVVELKHQILPNFDPDFSYVVQHRLMKMGVTFHLGQSISKIEPDPNNLVSGVATGSHGDKWSYDLLISAIGSRPNTLLAKNSGLELEYKSVKVDHHGRTSDPDIFAAGDVISHTHMITNSRQPIQLASPAHKSARTAALNIIADLLKIEDGAKHRLREVAPKVLGSSIIKIRDITIASTGITEAWAPKYGIKHFVSAIYHGKSHVSYYPDAEQIILKLIFEENGRLLGAVGLGFGHNSAKLDKSMDIISTTIAASKGAATVFDLEDLDLCYAPPFSAPKNVVNQIGMLGSNHVRGHRLINPRVLADILYNPTRQEESSHLILIDARTPGEYSAGHAEGARNYPVDTMENSLDEICAIPELKSKTICVYCAIGLRAYIAQRILQLHGFPNTVNVTGGWYFFSRALKQAAAKFS